MWISFHHLPVDQKIWQEACSVPRHSKTTKGEYFKARHYLLLLLQEDIGNMSVIVTTLSPTVRWHVLLSDVTYRSLCTSLTATLKRRIAAFILKCALFRKKDWWHHSSWYHVDYPRHIRMALVDQRNNLVATLSALMGPCQFHKKNSEAFIEQLHIQLITLHNTDILVSFKTVLLFTLVPLTVTAQWPG